MGFLHVVTGEGFECVLASGDQAFRLFESADETLMMTVDDPDAPRRALVLFNRNNPTGRHETGIFYNPVFGEYGDWLEILRFLGSDPELVFSAAKQHFDILSQQEGLEIMMIIDTGPRRDREKK